MKKIAQKHSISKIPVIAPRKVGMESNVRTISPVRDVFRREKSVGKIRDFEIRFFLHHTKKIAKRVSRKFEGLHISFYFDSSCRTTVTPPFFLLFFFSTGTLRLLENINCQLRFVNLQEVRLRCFCDPGPPGSHSDQGYHTLGGGPQ